MSTCLAVVRPAVGLMVLLGLTSTVESEAQLADFLGPHRTQTLVLDSPVPGTGRIGGITRDAYGYLYVANQDEGVWKVHPSGKVELFVRGLYGSGGNAITGSGDLLQADYNGDRILRIDRAGHVFPLVEEGLDGPVGIVVVRSGDAYAVNYRGGYVTRVTPDGVASEFVRDQRMMGPNGITADREGNLYVVNLRNTVVLKITPQGEVSEIATLPGTANAHVAFLNGSLYVTQIWSHVILKVEMDGSYTVVAGNGTVGFADGEAQEATLAYPNGIVASNSGDALFFNTLRGEMINGQVGIIDVRKLETPEPRRVFLQSFERGGTDELRATFQRAMSLREAVPAQIAPLLYPIARRFLDTGNLEPGLAMTTWVYEMDPDPARGSTQLANVHAVFGEAATAIQHYERVLELQPENDDVKRRLEAVRLYRRAGAGGR